MQYENCGKRDDDVKGNEEGKGKGYAVRKEKGQREKGGVRESMESHCGAFYHNANANVNKEKDNVDNTVAQSPTTVPRSSSRPSGVPETLPWCYIERDDDEFSLSGAFSSTHIYASNSLGWKRQILAQREMERRRKSEEHRANITQQELDEASSYWSSAMEQMGEAEYCVVKDNEDGMFCFKPDLYTSIISTLLFLNTQKRTR